MSHETETMRDAQRISERASYAERMAEAEVDLAHEFVHAVMTKRMNEPVEFDNRPVRIDGRHIGQRQSTVCEVMADAMDYSSNDAIVFKALVLCSRNGSIEATQAIEILARTFARINAEVD